MCSSAILPRKNPPNAMSRSLIVFPDAGPKPLLDAVESANKDLRIKMFLFSDPALLAAVTAAHKRGVHVRVMLNPARRSGEEENAATRRALEKAAAPPRSLK
jgi:cardiolipin synthase